MHKNKMQFTGPSYYRPSGRVPTHVIPTTTESLRGIQDLHKVLLQLLSTDMDALR